MKKCIFVFLIFFSLSSVKLQAELRHYFLGVIQLAGMEPDHLAHPGTSLQFEHIEKALLAPNQSEQGYIPRKFREPIQQMHQNGLEVQFEVRHLYENPLPGKFMNVEVWVTTDQPEKLIPLIFSIPAIEDHPLTVRND